MSEASYPSGRCVVCNRPLDDHAFKFTPYWFGKSDPYGNTVFDNHTPLQPYELPAPNIEPDEGVDSPHD